MVFVKKFSEFDSADLSDSGNELAGISGSNVNIIGDKIVTWTTATRPAPPPNAVIGFNTTINAYEYYDSSTATWEYIPSGSTSLTSLTAATGIILTPDPITTTGTIGLDIPVVVSSGGTGGISFTAYGLICGGTTDTGAFQSVVGVGTSGQILTSNGPGALPTFQTDTGAGTVTSLTEATGITLTPNPITSAGTIGLDIPVVVSSGGTGVTSLTAYGVVCGGTTGTGAVQSVSVGSSGEALVSNGPGALPSFQVVPGTGTVTSLTAATGIVLTPDPITTTGSIGLDIPVVVSSGGTGATSLTAYSVLCGGTTSTDPVQPIASVGTSGQVLTSNGAGALPTFEDSTGGVDPGTENQLAYYAATGTTVAGLTSANSAMLVTSSAGVPSWTSLTDGQLLIGNSGNTPTAAQIQGGTGISVANGSGSITISSSGGAGFEWNVETTTSATMAVGNGYIADNAGAVTFTLPASSTVGDSVAVMGMGAGGWVIDMQNSQIINIGTSATTSGSGSVASTDNSDSVVLICTDDTASNEVWQNLGAPQGTLDVT